MNKLNGQSLDIKEQNLQAMKQLFPEAFEEGKIDFDVLRQLLGDYVDDAKERYSFKWNGKGEAIRISQTPSTGTLRPCKEESKNWDSTENLYIEGDNLEVLKLLQKSYMGKVKMIYIEPPYNTGNDRIYKDDFSDNIINYKKITKQLSINGIKQNTNTENNGRLHINWLNMIYPRLKLARNLLSDDGVIFISIDDNEQDNLKKICDEIFGESNFIAQITRESIKGGSQSKYIRVTHDYILIFAKSKDKVTFGGIKLEGYNLNLYDEKGAYKKGRELNKWGAGSRREDSPSMFFPIKGPNGKDVYPIRNDGTEGRWRLGKEKMYKILKEENVIFEPRADGTYIVYEKIRDNSIREKQFGSIFKDNYINAKGTEILKNLFCSQRAYFDYAKPVILITDLCKINKIQDEDIVLDFFSGSATTAHAVMQLNAEDGGNRKFIMVQLPELTDEKSEAYKAGYKNICEIGKERIRRAGEKIKKDFADKEGIDNLDIGFKVFKLDSSNLKKWQAHTDEGTEGIEDILLHNMERYMPNRSQIDIIYEIMLKMGLDLTYPVEEKSFDKQKIYVIGAGALMICLDDDINVATAEYLIKLHDEYEPETWQVVLADSGFNNDEDKANVKEHLKCCGLNVDESLIVI